jgi:hypothetical protein
VFVRFVRLVVLCSLKLQGLHLVDAVPQFPGPGNQGDLLRGRLETGVYGQGILPALQGCFVLASDEAIYKIMCLALRNAARKWTMPIKDWGVALNQFALVFGERVPLL